jgi:hypothetical protein
VNRANNHRNILPASGDKALVPPVTLHAVLSNAVGENLRYCYRVDEEIPHSLLVILMQMNEEKRRKAAAA